VSASEGIELALDSTCAVTWRSRAPPSALSRSARAAVAETAADAAAPAAELDIGVVAPSSLAPAQASETAAAAAPAAELSNGGTAPFLAPAEHSTQKN